MNVLTRRGFMGLACGTAMAALAGCAAPAAAPAFGPGEDRELADAAAAREGSPEELAGQTIAEEEDAVNSPAQVQTDLPEGFRLADGEVTLNNGVVMPANGLGTYSLTGQVCLDSVGAALASGVRLIDTAYMYGNEAEVGRAVRESGVPREEVFVITKLYPSQFSDAEAAIEEALGKMDLGYIDLMLLHHPGTGDVEAYRAMERALAAGKLRAIGLSCYYVDELTAFLPRVSVKPALVQNEIHPYYQDAEVVPFIHDQGIAVQAWYPLGGRGHNDELLGDPVLASIAQAHGVSIPQVILRWDLQRGVIVIPRSSNPAHIEEDTQFYHFALTEDEMAAIAALNRNERHRR